MLINNTENTKLLHGKEYPAGHDWTVHFKHGFDDDGEDPQYTAFVVVYTSPDSLHDHDVVLFSKPYDTKEEALQDVVEFLRRKVVSYFDDWR